MDAHPTPSGCRPGGCAGLCTEDGLARAYAEHHPRMLARARRIVVDPHLAEEAVQEAFTRAWRACSTFDPAVGPLTGWLLTITGNVAVDLVRARTRRPPVAPGDAGVQEGDDTGDIDRLLLRAELREALLAISEEQRRAVVETIVLDRPGGEVAHDLGINPATLRTRVHYGLQRLRVALAPPVPC
ncbi:sigma-70 family RNA polymerase sigma factor [Nocardioides conyzicola]|uniref:Sigma-70 family RNA polymerase sigma factor n=1 Tax=Nocardioides conyzicola TaxID=1651781 RepID=A0ABP8X3G7_9ACTN